MKGRSQREPSQLLPEQDAYFSEYLEGLQLAEEFSQSISLKPTIKATERAQTYSIRHRVYCEELGLEPETESRQETDFFDEYSYSCLAQLKRDGSSVGTVRIVAPTRQQELPLEAYCRKALEQAPITPSDFCRTEICEVSRLAIPAQFRRRTNTNQQMEVSQLSSLEQKALSYLGISLYFKAATMALALKRQHVFVMMEPRLSRSLARAGLQFTQLAPAVNYHGKRAPYYIDLETLKTTLPWQLRPLFQQIGRSLLASSAHISYLPDWAVN